MSKRKRTKNGRFVKTKKAKSTRKRTTRKRTKRAKRAKRRPARKVHAHRKPRRHARRTYHRKPRRIGALTMKKNAIIDALVDTLATSTGLLVADIGAGQLTQRGILDANMAAGAAGVVGLGTAVIAKRGALRTVGIGMSAGAVAGLVRAQLPDGWVSGLSDADRRYVEEMAVNGPPTIAGTPTIAADDYR